MRFQILRFSPDGTPVAPLAEAHLAQFPTLTFNKREDRYEIELLRLQDALDLASLESCVVRLVDTSGGEEPDLPILELVDNDADPLERAAAALETWRADPAVQTDPEGLIDLQAAINIVRSCQRFSP